MSVGQRIAALEAEIARLRVAVESQTETRSMIARHEAMDRASDRRWVDFDRQMERVRENAVRQREESDRFWERWERDFDRRMNRQVGRRR